MTCPCGDKCSNQRIQRREWLSRSLEKFLTEDRGFGVRTTHVITAGTFQDLTLSFHSHSLVIMSTLTSASTESHCDRAFAAAGPMLWDSLRSYLKEVDL